MIVVGYAHEIAPETKAALEGFEYVLAYVGDRDDAYFDLLQAWWVSNEWDVITLEHDIIPKPELLQELIDCPRAWCACLYPFEEHWLYGLGLTKFNLEMRQHLPGLFDEIAVLEGGPHHPPKHWCALDSHMQGILHARSGEAVHIHNRQDLIEQRVVEGHEAVAEAGHV